MAMDRALLLRTPLALKISELGIAPDGRVARAFKTVARESFVHGLPLDMQLLNPRGVPWGGVHSLLLTSPRSALGFGESLTVHGTDEAQTVIRETLLDWRSRGCPSLEELHIRVEPSAEQLAEIPALRSGRYRFRRGPDSIELWYDS